MNQPDLFGGAAAAAPLGRTGAARANDPATSKAAAEANPIARGKGHHQVLYALERGTELGYLLGLNDYEIAYVLGREALRGAVAKRRGELGFPHRSPALVTFQVQGDGGTLLRLTDTGQSAIVRRITLQGITVLRQLGPPWAEDSFEHVRMTSRLGELCSTAPTRGVK